MKTEICHFWVGNFKSEDLFYDFFEEDKRFYENESNSDGYVSEFSASQSENWIDFDFLECGFENNAKPVNEKFGKYSYAAKWMDALETKINALNLTDLNAIAFINKSEIENPVSVNRKNFDLHYLGEIEYEV
ncbi:immunity 22 family protein [Pedobacter nototheniae]|uniref:immunity 22 family protein n=1 Tax=Pedobacter nototheniae TaxID=2488994 RepID=UPI00292EDC19|nr:immunity 22 family protein [Pedobacter nototheniae]